MHSLLKYSNNKFEVDDISFSNEIVKQIHPEYACDDTIKELSYQIGNPNNCIYYLDGSVVSLSQYEPKYNEIILLASKFQFEQNELLFKEQITILNQPKPVVKLRDLFAEGVTTKEQDNLINQLKNSAPDIIIDDAFFYEVLNKLKKSLLKASDWTQLPDVQEAFSNEDREAWLKYRASLRVLDKIKEPLKARIPNTPNN
jgi:hypothetical protein